MTYHHRHRLLRHCKALGSCRSKREREKNVGFIPVVRLCVRASPSVKHVAPRRVEPLVSICNLPSPATLGQPATVAKRSEGGGMAEHVGSGSGPGPGPGPGPGSNPKTACLPAVSSRVRSMVNKAGNLVRRFLPWSSFRTQASSEKNGRNATGGVCSLARVWRRASVPGSICPSLRTLCVVHRVYRSNNKRETEQSTAETE